MHSDKKKWALGEVYQRRWFALNEGTLYWFGGYFDTKGSVVLTPGTKLRIHPVTKEHPYQISVITPEMGRAGISLALRAASMDHYRTWSTALTEALEEVEELARASANSTATGGSAGQWLKRLTGKSKR